MRNNMMLKNVLSGMLVLSFLLQPMSFQAQEDLTKKATNVNILVQEPMNALFQQEEGKDATVETLEYRYWFDENNGDGLTADVDVMIDMTVSGMGYEIEAEGEVSGEKLASGSVLWMGPVEGELEIDNIEYLVMVGFTKMDELVQISVTIQSMDDGEAIEPVMFSFGDCVISEEIYQEIEENKETVDIESKQARSRASSTYIMNSRSILNQPQLEGGSRNAYTLINSITANFASGPTGEIGQKLYGYFDEGNDRVAIGIRSYCSYLENYYSKVGNTTTYVESMKYTIKRGSNNKSEISNIEPFDFNIGTSGGYGLMDALFSDALTLTNQSLALETIKLMLSGLWGDIDYNENAAIAQLNLKFGAGACANFDRVTGGMPIIFSLRETYIGYTGKHEYILTSSIKYRSLVKIVGATNTYYTTYYNSAQDASCTVKIDLG